MANEKIIKTMLIEANRQGLLGEHEINILYCQTLNTANKILRFLGKNPEKSSKEIATYIGYTRSSTLIYLRELRRLKYVESSSVRQVKFWRLTRKKEV